jgi:16S rRNA (guanine527-N7)-methyltransferase
MKAFDKSSFQSEFNCSDEVMTRLYTYEETLRLWQRKINLVSPSTLDDIWTRHFADSAQIFSFLPAGQVSILDMGAGAGFPGMVLAIMLAGAGEEKSGSHVQLVESDQRKASFLREVKRLTRVAVDIDVRRIEISSNQGSFDSFDVVTARALAPLDKLLAYAEPYFGGGSIGVFPKGKSVESEIAAAEAGWTFDHELAPSRTDPEGRIVLVRNLRRRN